MNRRNFLFSIIIWPNILKYNYQFNDGDHVDVWYSDVGPYKPQWTTCVVDKDKCYRVDGKGYFKIDHMVNNYYWRHTKYPKKIFTPHSNK
jgi:hypothetical protein